LTTRERYSHETPIVYVVDGDTTTAESLEALISPRGWRVRSAESAEEFLAQARMPVPSCLVLEAHLSGLSGLDLQRALADQPEMPVVFMSARADTQTVVRAIRAGALEFLVKPCAPETLISTLAAAIERSREELQNVAQVRLLEERYQSLSHRERDVMRLVVSGRLNKQVGVELGITEITVKAHRGRVMRKMRARTFAELIGMAATLPRTPANTFAQLQSFAGLRTLEAVSGM
jgi:FixJ family two-component response regulator